MTTKNDELIIHQDIYEKLNHFRIINKIPNIIFHGPCGSGKSTIVEKFIKDIYDNDKEKNKNYVMKVNCAHGKGIKFIRDELKFFSRSSIPINSNDTLFKSIILRNADKLTSDAQSALRRCIELSCHTTRYFIVVEDKYQLLKPILSRFCEIYVSYPLINNKRVNLHKYKINQNNDIQKFKNDKKVWINKTLITLQKKVNIQEIEKVSNKLYEKGYSALDIIDYINNCSMESSKKFEILAAIQKIKKEFRNERLLIFFILNFFYLDTSYSLENITFI